MGFDGGQGEQLARVSARLRRALIAFANKRGAGAHFVAEDLREVCERLGAAPDSAGRVFRMLRAEGVVDYRVVNRARSQYQLLRVPSDPVAAVPPEGTPPPSPGAAATGSSTMPAHVRGDAVRAATVSHAPADVGQQFDFGDYLERCR